MNALLIAAVGDSSDVTACAEEPTHLVGSIQQHRALIAARRRDLVVVPASAHVVDLGAQASAVTGRSLPLNKARVSDDVACTPAPVAAEGRGGAMTVPVLPTP